MNWVRWNVSNFDEPKLIRAGVKAAFLYHLMFLSCGRHETDGEVSLATTESLAIMYGLRAAWHLKTLLQVGLIEKRGTGFYLPAFLEQNPSHLDMEHQRAVDRQRKVPRALHPVRD